MPESKQARSSSANVPITVQLEGARPDDNLDALKATIYDRTGKAVAQTDLKVSRKGDAFVAEGAAPVDPKALGGSARVVISPPAAQGDEGRLPKRSVLEKRFRAWTEPVRFNPQEPGISLRIPRPGWEIWPRLCICWIRGRLVKRVYLPDGTIRDLPICHARVTICEVDRWPWIIARLPDRELIRLRDDLLEVIRQPFPFPDPPPEPWPGPIPDFAPFPGPVPDPLPIERSLPVRRAAPILRRVARAAAPMLASSTTNDSDENFAQSPSMLLAGRIATAPAPLLREALLSDLSIIRPYLCLLDWLEPWFFYSKHCFATVTTDEQGRFSAFYVHACSDPDQPDIYISAEQFLGGVWTKIFAPSIRCGTHWNYTCGEELTILVRDPRARPCVPDDPVDPPAGVDNWVMPYAVGAMPIQGTAAAGPSLPGWVRPDGMADHGPCHDSPFGAVLGFRQQHSLTIPNAGAYYYRWSFRRGTTGNFTAMTDPVTRSYVRDLPGPSVSFPNVLLGPQPGDVFRFKTQLFSTADWGVDTTGDPAGTSYYWPIDNSIGDIYAARWTTPGTQSPDDAPALADFYQVKVEVFDNAKARVTPGAGTFRFIVPLSIDPDGTLQTRLADASEIVDDGFIFNLLVDNSRCTAFILPPVLSAGVADDECGFLRYAPGSSVTLAFQALHPNDHALFTLSLIRGATNVPAAGVSPAAEVAAANAGGYSQVGDTFTGSFTVASLVEDCPSAAFAQHLDLDAKATDGTRRLSEYDDAFIRAFALAEITP